MGKSSLNLARLRAYTFPIENPVSGDDIPRIRMDRAFTVQKIVALKIGGGTSFDWELRFSPDASDIGAGTLLESDTGVSNNTTGVEYLPPFDPGDPATIPADDWLWLELPVVPTGFSRPTAITVIAYGVET